MRYRVGAAVVVVLLAGYALGDPDQRMFALVLLGATVLVYPVLDILDFFRLLDEGFDWTRSDFVSATRELVRDLLLTGTLVSLAGLGLADGVALQFGAPNAYETVGLMFIRIGAALIAGLVAGVVLAFVGKAIR